MAYTDYLVKFAENFEARYAAIAAKYNFDLGDEFEIAFCETMRTVLPGRFGICRGFLVNRKEESAGDDIIIFDRDQFPTLRMLPQNDYSRKEHVPVEATCAYIE